MTPIDVILSGIRNSFDEPTGFDTNEEKLLREKEKIRKEEIYPILRPVAYKFIGGFKPDSEGRILWVGAIKKETSEEPQGEQDKGEEINTEVSLVDGFIDVQNDE